MKYHLSTGTISGLTVIIISLAVVFLCRRYRKCNRKYKDDFEGWI
ncbi:hypothetical protein [Mucilaginibacter celer]|nr:hypothetical protein [Mucilaginibacter celer]